MKKLNVLSAFLIAIASMILLYLSYCNESGIFGVSYQFVISFFKPVLLVGALTMPLWFFLNKQYRGIAIFIFSSILFVALMAENIEFTKDMDKLNKSTKEINRINDFDYSGRMKDLKKLFAGTHYSAEEYGDSAPVLHFLKGRLICRAQEEKKRHAVFEAINIDQLISENTLFSVNKLSQYRTRIDNAIECLIKLEAQTIKSQKNLRDSEWKYSFLKNELFRRYTDENNALMVCYRNAYINLKEICTALDEITIYLINNQGKFFWDESLFFYSDEHANEFANLWMKFKNLNDVQI